MAHDCLSLLNIMVVCANGMSESHPNKFASDDDIMEFYRAAERLRQPAELLLAHRRRDPPGQQPINVNQVIAQSERMLARVLAPATSLRRHRAGNGEDRSVGDRTNPAEVALVWSRISGTWSGLAAIYAWRRSPARRRRCKARCNSKLIRSAIRASGLTCH